jgi:hypothetical protein
MAVRNGNFAAAGSAGEMEKALRVAFGATNAVTLDASTQLKGRLPATLAEKYVDA